MPLVLKGLFGSGWFRWLATLIALPILGLVMAIGGELVSDEQVATALVEGIDSGAIGTEERTKTYLGYTIDHHSECIGLTTGLGNEGRGVVEVALASPNLGSCSVAVPYLEEWSEGDPLVRNWDYLRYWHGHAALIRPVLAAGGVEAVRVVILVLLLAAWGAFFLTLRSRTTTLAATLFCLPLALGTDLLVTPQSGPHGVAAVAVFLTGSVVLIAISRDPTLATVAVVSSLSAGLIVLVDVFTMGTLSWTMTTALVGVSSWSAGIRNSKLLKYTAIGAVAWLVGYVTTWVSKWVFASAVVGFNDVLERVSNSIATRTLGEVDYIDLGLGNTTTTVISWWLATPVGKALALLAVAWVVMAAMKAYRAGHVALWMILSSPAVLPVIWFEIMQNHTQVHIWFTALRGVGISLAVILLAAELVRSHPVRPSPRRGAKSMEAD